VTPYVPKDTPLGSPLIFSVVFRSAIRVFATPEKTRAPIAVYVGQFQAPDIFFFSPPILRGEPPHLVFSYLFSSTFLFKVRCYRMDLLDAHRKVRMPCRLDPWNLPFFLTLFSLLRLTYLDVCEQDNPTALVCIASCQLFRSFFPVLPFNSPFNVNSESFQCFSPPFRLYVVSYASLVD